METVDFTRTYRALYAAPRGVVEVDAEAATFLAVAGEGAPSEPAHAAAIERLYELTWALKLALEYGGVVDFKVPPLECLWLSDPTIAPNAPWQWRVMMRIPTTVTEAEIAGSRRYVQARKGLDASDVLRFRFAEGRALQALHTGPYGEEAETYAQLDAHAKAHGLLLEGAGHDIYLNDPDRVAAEKLRTIIRLPVARRRKAATARNS